jgi:hypothetical protein
MSVFPDRAGPFKIAHRFAQPEALERPAKAEALHSVMISLEDASLRNSSKGKAIWRIGAVKSA